MRFSIIVALVATLQISAAGYSQTATVSVHLKNVGIIDVFNEIERQSEYKVFYKTANIDKLQMVTIDRENIPVDVLLHTVLNKNQLSYEVIDKVIVITPIMEAAVQQGITVTGTITDETGQPMPGVNVRLKGTTTGVITDINGRYSIAVPGKDAILVYSFVGYATHEFGVGDQTEINIELNEDTQEIEEVVVIGYGVQKKVNLTGAVGHVTSEVLQNRPITNVGQGLQGVIPNLNVTFSDGNPASSPSFNIRGTTTISGESGSPLVLVDGVQMDLNLVNPNDIESVSVLKDAASSAIYGARGAFGVILVTTKGGKKERQAQIEFNGSIQWNTPTYLPDMLRAVDYVQAKNEASFLQTGTNTYSTEQVQWVMDYNEDPANAPVYHMLANGKIFWNGGNDNYAQMLQKWAPIQKYTLSMNGGTKRTSYYASMGYMDQKGMFKDATDVLGRYNFLLNMQVDLTDKLHLGVRGSYVQSVYDEPHRYTGKGSSWWEQMTRGEPQILFPIKTPANSPVGAGVPTEHFYNFLNSGSRNVAKTENALFSVQAGYDLYKGLKLKGDFSYNTINVRIKDVQKEFGFIRDSWTLQNNQTAPSYVQRDAKHTDYFTLNMYLDYNTVIRENHNISVLAGFNQEWNVFSSFYSKKENLVSMDVPAINLATGEDYVGDSENDWAIRGLFMRLHYNYKGKYLFEMNGRYDGSSKFPEKSRFAFFPSFSAGWRISGEEFMSNLSTTLSDLKIRASYGSLGNQNVSGNYPYISNFTVTQQVPYIINGGLPLGIGAPGLVSDDLTWETTTSSNIGIDVGLWQKLTLNFDWYNRLTKEMLVAGDKLPAVLGTSVPRRNSANLKTTGWDLSIRWNDKLANHLRYDVGFILSDYSAKISKFDNNPDKLYTNYYVGQKIGEIWGYETVGIFQNASEVQAQANQDQLGNGGKWGPGDIQYANLNEDNVINYGDRTVGKPGDTKIIGNTTPRFQFGFTGNVEWRGFDCNVFFQGLCKRDFWPTGTYFWGARNNAAAVGTYYSYQDAWRENQRDAYFPMYKAGSGYNIQTQTRFLQSGAYVRFKNLTIGYTLPSQISEKIRISKIRIYGAAQNLWEFSKIKGEFDPEIIGTVGEYYPLQRSIMCGILVVL